MFYQFNTNIYKMRNIFCSVVILILMQLCSPAFPQDGFGRFGQYNDDGLLTLNVYPHKFNFEGMFTSLEVTFANSSVSASVQNINTTSKQLALSGSDSVSPDSVYYSLLYPGFSVDYGIKDSATIKINTDNVTLDKAPDTAEPFFYWLLIRPKTGSNIPFAIAFRQNFKPDLTTLIDEGSTSRIEITGTDIGEVRVIVPNGIKLFSSSAPVQTLRDMTDSWAKIGVPVLQSRNYSYNKTNETVTITENFTTTMGQGIAPIPPVLAFAMEKGYPATTVQTLIRTECITKYGKFAYADGNTISYTLPVPPLEERGYIRINGNQTRKDQLNTLVAHLPASWCQNAVDLAYAGVTNAQMAHPYLTTANKNSVKNAWTDYLWKAYMIPLNGSYNPTYSGPKAWKEKTEPFSNTLYLWTYKIDGPAPDLYPLDIEWGIMLPLYGMYKYALYTGDWDFVRDNWWEVRDHIYKYVDKGDDWAWMTVVNGDMGYSTGTGDPMTANFCGTVACLKMAKALGETADENYFAYKAARAAVPAVSRLWYTDWARNYLGSIPQTNTVIGFWEKRSVVSAKMDEASEDPWSSTNILSGDGILPEMYLAMVKFAKDALKQYETEFAAGYPDWANKNHAYSFSTTYSGNSVYVTFPHIFLRAMLGEETTATLWGYVDSAYETSSSSYFVGPNVLAELLSRDAPILLTGWQPAAYTDGYHDTTSGDKAVLDFTLPATATNWTLTGIVKDTLEPASVTVNSIAKGFEFNHTTREFKITLDAQGATRVIISFQGFTNVNDWNMINK